MDIVLNESEQKRIIDRGDDFLLTKDKLDVGECIIFRTPAYEYLGFASVNSCLKLEAKINGDVKLYDKIYLVHFERCIE